MNVVSPEATGIESLRYAIPDDDELVVLPVLSTSHALMFAETSLAHWKVTRADTTNHRYWSSNQGVSRICSPIAFGMLAAVNSVTDGHVFATGVAGISASLGAVMFSTAPSLQAIIAPAASVTARLRYRSRISSSGVSATAAPASGSESPGSSCTTLPSVRGPPFRVSG